MFKISLHQLTLPFLISSRASCTTLFTFEAMQRYLKNLWWADQNWPHMDFFMRCSASMRSAACWNLSRALTHWTRKGAFKFQPNPTSQSSKEKANLTRASYQFHRFIVHFNVFLWEQNFVDFEGYTWKTQLSGYVHSSQLHIHSNYFHGTNTSEIKEQFKSILEFSRARTC